jgi:two-component system, NarL family, invasion response regulator UvrY
VWHHDPVAQSAVTVLVVDDQAPFREVAKAVVSATSGFELIGEAESGQLAIERVESLAPDLVLMDINMAGMNGVDAARRISWARPDTVTFLLSTYDVADLPAAAKSCGAAAYIHKEEFGPKLLSELWAKRGDADWRLPPRLTA